MAVTERGRRCPLFAARISSRYARLFRALRRLLLLLGLFRRDERPFQSDSRLVAGAHLHIQPLRFAVPLPFTGLIPTLLAHL